MKFIFQCLLALLVGFLAFLYYGLVLPRAVAGGIALIIFIAATFAIISKNLEFKAALFGGAVVAAWPAGALLIQGAGLLFNYSVPDSISRAGAIFAAFIAAQASFSLAEKRDRARDIGCISLCAISIFTVISSLFSGSRLAVGIACAGVVLTLFMVRQHLILPPDQENILSLGVKVAGVAAGLNVMLSFI
jgi:hypothetical protein